MSDAISRDEWGDDDRLLPLSEAARLIPGKRHCSTMHRWRLRGVRGVRLRTCLIGGRRHVKIAWLREFINAMSTQHDQLAKPPEASLRRRSEAENSELDELGL